ncbi:hypothetical protein GCM10017576_22380 [Microbacterium barkeri]|uniref:Uncharacterized protein n=1 Tax=Microbacterium barkeri TaxID=33917 RepID=A0A9W6H4V0_9MICO|nr:hypothetical protein GCM10017576_22380 [Microbacterium barkeri]
MPARTAALEEAGEHRGVQAVDEREIRIDGRRGERVAEGPVLFQSTDDSLNSHRRSLVAPSDTGTTDIRAPPS